MMNHTEHTFQAKADCEEAIQQLVELFERQGFNVSKVDELCQQFPQCQDQIREIAQTWGKLGAVSMQAPSELMNQRFYEMLEREMEQELSNTSVNMDLLEDRYWKGYLKWGLIAAVFVIGLAVGLLFPKRIIQKSDQPQVVDTKKLDKEASLTYAALTNDRSALDRLQGTQMSRKLPELNDQIIHALNKTLLFDPNVNVRLSAIETMVHFADNPHVRELLISAIPFQTAPIVQLTLAKVMAEWQEKAAADPIRQLIQSEEVEIEVKLELEETLETLM